MINAKCPFLTIVIVFNLLLCPTCSASEGGSPDDYPQHEHHDIVIVGGGIAGLTCGYALKNTDFILLEKNSRVGGRAVSGVHNNFTYAKGAEYLGEPEEYLAQMIDELGLEPKEIPSPMDAYFDGKIFIMEVTESNDIW